MSLTSQVLCFGALFFGTLTIVLAIFRYRGACQEALVAAWFSAIVTAIMIAVAAGNATPHVPMTPQQLLVQDAINTCSQNVPNCNVNIAIKDISDAGGFR